jgi:hypothetical protein
VVDYCLVPHEHLNAFGDFKIILVSDLLNDAGIVGTIDPSTSKPDHSLLYWTMDIDIYRETALGDTSTGGTFTVYDRSSVPEDFFLESTEQLNSVISRLEAEEASQESVNSIYSQLTDIVNT